MKSPLNDSWSVMVGTRVAAGSWIQTSNRNFRKFCPRCCVLTQTYVPLGVGPQVRPEADLRPMHA